LITDSENALRNISSICMLFRMVTINYKLFYLTFSVNRKILLTLQIFLRNNKKLNI